ncbi:hypothetical protein CDAR_487851 [Caerostris darwini]|uniref:Secreted protein n=1 Tax=Caerostris darwini TaxID=1538125 RepID=A0AAV4TZ67_9ARAC|nr:hypothetical protein CDAR_487851 [Caerostris darwini]
MRATFISSPSILRLSFPIFFLNTRGGCLCMKMHKTFCGLEQKTPGWVREGEGRNVILEDRPPVSGAAPHPHQSSGHPEKGLCLHQNTEK